MEVALQPHLSCTHPLCEVFRQEWAYTLETQQYWCDCHG